MSNNSLEFALLPRSYRNYKLFFSFTYNWALKVQRAFDSVQINHWSRYSGCLIDSDCKVKITAHTGGVDHYISPLTKTHQRTCVDNKWTDGLNFYYKHRRSYLKWEISCSSQYWWIINYLQWKQTPGCGSIRVWLHFELIFLSLESRTPILLLITALIHNRAHPFPRGTSRKI